MNVRELAAGASLRPFIELAWRVYRDDPVWVPPLRRHLAALLDRRRHPFHRHAEVAHFLAERSGRVVGRIAAVVNHLHNDRHGERTGFFGFFECLDDQQAADALLAAAAEWLGRRGMERLRGPVSYSTNDECGVLIDGFDRPPALLTPHTPPYYPRLLEAAGLAKAKDLLAYHFAAAPPPGRLAGAAVRIAERHGVRLRPLQLGRLDRELATIQSIYNAAWERNWGFVPLTAAEIAFMAAELKPLVDPELCLVAEQGERAVGFSLTLPDLNQALRHLDGRLFPFGLLRLARERRKIDRVRILALGVAPPFRRRGVDAALTLRTWEAGLARGYLSGEASWILEDNRPMRQALEKLGGRVDRTYRIYERSL